MENMIKHAEHEIVCQIAEDFYKLTFILLLACILNIYRIQRIRCSRKSVFHCAIWNKDNLSITENDC